MAHWVCCVEWDPPPCPRSCFPRRLLHEAAAGGDMPAKWVGRLQPGKMGSRTVRLTQGRRWQLGLPGPRWRDRVRLLLVGPGGEGLPV